MTKRRSVRGSEISATRKVERERERLPDAVRRALSEKPQTCTVITYSKALKGTNAGFERVRAALVRLYENGEAACRIAEGHPHRWTATAKLVAWQNQHADQKMRCRLIAALDGTNPLACTKKEIQALERWHGSAIATRFDARTAAIIVMSKLTGATPGSLSLCLPGVTMPRPSSVLVIDGGARWAYDVVNVGPAAIELRYQGASAERETRMFRRSDGAAIDDPSVRIAPEDLAQLTGRTTAEIARAAGEAAGREVARGFAEGLGCATDAAMKQGLGGEGPVPAWMRVGQRVRAIPSGKSGAIVAIDRDVGITTGYIEVKWDNGASLLFSESDAAKNLEPVSDASTHDIHAQIDAWTKEALQGLAPRVAARIWQAYRAGQGGGYSEAGHEMAAQEAERLRAELSGARKELCGAEASLRRHRTERDEAQQALALARAALGDIQEELHLAETSLVTTAKERDDATDKVRELSGHLQERADQWAKAMVDKAAAEAERDAARAELADLRAGISALTSGRAA